MKKGKANTVCADCGKGFHRAPSAKLVRCPVCRKGKRGVRKAGYSPRHTCPRCGGYKSWDATRCQKCYGADLTEQWAAQMQGQGQPCTTTSN